MTTKTKAPATILDGDRDKLRVYIRQLADAMGLRDWVITVGDEPMPDSATVDADIFCAYGQRWARVRLATGWETWPPEKLRATVVHECIHPHLNSITSTVDNVQSLIGEAVYRPLHNTLVDIIEYATDGIAVAWAEFLPLPVEGEAKETA